MPTTKHVKSYQILISASTDSEAKPYFKHQRLNIRSAIELQLRCTETSVLLEQNEYIVPLEAVSSFVQTVKVIVPEECPTQNVSFILLCRESKSIQRPAAKLDVRLEGTYNPIDASFIE